MTGKFRLMAVATLTSAALVALPAYGASASAYASAGVSAVADASTALDSAPDCATTWTGHDVSKWVKVRNDCGHTIRIKIVIQYNFDSPCKVLGAGKTYFFRYGAASFLDEVRSC
ncbi:hypothetical protein ABGB18_08680 [Nonomuraea sp. B12E4]|uniref:hypothetical protein n=1 Tax=Nonomuraea sp. B12E4 TaxID=3153564 RepID=UPI00325D4609